MNLNFKLGKTYKFTYLDGHVTIATYKGYNPPSFEVDGEFIVAYVLLKGNPSYEEIEG